MLREIRCDKFLDQGKLRGTIRFKEGLNVVLGDERGTNSIGKTTFLLAIDFAFGGNSYTSIDENLFSRIGHHCIMFNHHFDGADNRFLRDTADSNVVWRCSDTYAPLQKMSLTEFNEWLNSACGLASSGGTFRSLAGTFFRIYGKGNLDETNPLSAHKSESNKEGVSRLIKLFGQYQALSKLEEDLSQVNEKKKALRAAKKFEFVRGASGKKDAARNESRILTLKESLSELVAIDHNNLSDLEPLKAEQLADLKAKLSFLERQRLRIETQIKGITNSLDSAKFARTNDFEDLTKYFPDADVKRLEEIESFHSQVYSILKKQNRKETDSLKAQLEVVNSQIANLRAEASSIGSVSNVTEAVLKRYAYISHEIQQLEDANRAYEEELALNEEASTCKKRLADLSSQAASMIEMDINTEMKMLNSRVCGWDRSAPRMHIDSPKKYTFNVPLDGGTGSKNRGMVLLDCSILKLTPIPAIAHDSVCLKHIEDDVMVNLFDVYDESEKQVFIAIDKASGYISSGEIPKVLEDSTVIELGLGHELFGESWGTEKEAERIETQSLTADNDVS